MTKLIGDAVDSTTVSDGLIMHNNLADYHLHMMNAETLADHSVVLEGICDPTISSWGIIGRSSSNGLGLSRSELGSSGGNVLSDRAVDSICVVEGRVFFLDEETGQAYMMDIHGESTVKL